MSSLPLPESDLPVEDANGGGKTQGKPSQPHGKYQQKHQTQPEGGDAAEDVAEFFQNPVWQPVPGHAHGAAQTKADEAGEQPGAEHQSQRVHKPLPNDLQNRATI